jgi:hypothetical protein
LEVFKSGGGEFLFDLDFDRRERDDFARKEPALLEELRRFWEIWSEEMPPVPEHLTAPISNFTGMLW